MIFALAYFFHITLPESLYEGVEIAMFEIRSKPFKRSAHLNNKDNYSPENDKNGLYKASVPLHIVGVLMGN